MARGEERPRFAAYGQTIQRRPVPAPGTYRMRLNSIGAEARRAKDSTSAQIPYAGGCYFELVENLDTNEAAGDKPARVYWNGQLSFRPWRNGGQAPLQPSGICALARAVGADFEEPLNENPAFGPFILWFDVPEAGAAAPSNPPTNGANPITDSTTELCAAINARYAVAWLKEQNGGEVRGYVSVRDADPARGQREAQAEVREFIANESEPMATELEEEASAPAPPPLARARSNGTSARTPSAAKPSGKAGRRHA